MEIVNG
jgi:hypothetical protein